MLTRDLVSQAKTGSLMRAPNPLPLPPHLVANADIRASDADGRATADVRASDAGGSATADIRVSDAGGSSD